MALWRGFIFSLLRNVFLIRAHTYIFVTFKYLTHSRLKFLYTSFYFIFFYPHVHFLNVCTYPFHLSSQFRNDLLLSHNNLVVIPLTPVFWFLLYTPLLLLLCSTDTLIQVWSTWKNLRSKIIRGLVHLLRNTNKPCFGLQKDGNGHPSEFCGLVFHNWFGKKKEFWKSWYKTIMARVQRLRQLLHTRWRVEGCTTYDTTEIPRHPRRQRQLLATLLKQPPATTTTPYDTSDSTSDNLTDSCMQSLRQIMTLPPTHSDFDSYLRHSFTSSIICTYGQMHNERLWLHQRWHFYNEMKSS